MFLRSHKAMREQASIRSRRTIEPARSRSRLGWGRSLSRLGREYPPSRSGVGWESPASRCGFGWESTIEPARSRSRLGPEYPPSRSGFGWGWFHFALRCSLSAFHSALFALCFSLFAILLPAPASAQDCYYTWETIRDPGGGSPTGWALNNHGVVAGTVDYVGDNTRAFTWSREAGFQLLPLIAGYTSMKAKGINDLGQVVGECDNPSWAGFIWNIQTQSYTIIELPIRSVQIYVNDINNRGEVVGGLYHRYPQQPYFWDPFVWQNGEWTFLGDLIAPRTGWATGVNEHGDLVGHAAGAGGYHAFLIENRQTMTWLPEPPGFVQSEAEAINNNKVVVGFAKWPSPIHIEAVVWTPTWMLDVYTPGPTDQSSSLRGVSDAARVCGLYYGPFISRAFVGQYGTPTLLRDLLPSTPSTPYPFSAYAINDAGQIVADSTIDLILLTPHWRPGDVTGDCHVDLMDLALVLSEFGLPVGSFPAADVNHDGQVDLTDLATVLTHFGD